MANLTGLTAVSFSKALFPPQTSQATCSIPQGRSGCCLCFQIEPLGLIVAIEVKLDVLLARSLVPCSSRSDFMDRAGAQLQLHACPEIYSWVSSAGFQSCTSTSSPRVCAFAAVAAADLLSARAIFRISIFFLASPLSLRISVAVHGRSPVEFFVIHVSLKIPPHGGGYFVRVLRRFHARRNHARRKNPRIVSPGSGARSRNANSGQQLCSGWRARDRPTGAPAHRPYSNATPSRFSFRQMTRQ